MAAGQNKSLDLVGRVSEIETILGVSPVQQILNLGLQARLVSQVAAVANLLTVNGPAGADGSFLVMANVRILSGTSYSFTVNCLFTDETGAQQSPALSFFLTSQPLVTTLSNGQGNRPLLGVPLYIRAQAGTQITIITNGTFTTVSYNVEGNVIQLA